MAVPQYSRMGLTRSKANNLSNQGYKHHAYLPVNRARPMLENVDFRAAPIREEGVMLYSFSSPDDFLAFCETYEAEKLL